MNLIILIISIITAFPVSATPFDIRKENFLFTPKDWSTTATIESLKLASYLSEPVCKVRESYYSLYTPDSKDQSTVEKIARQCSLVLSIISYTTIAPITASLGAAIRGGVASLVETPVIELHRGGESKQLPANRTIRIASFNVCLMPAGYSITDGQVSPPSDRNRIDRLVEMIRSQDPDILCLNEVADISDAEYLSAKLPEYPYLVPVAGIRAIGPSSMLYVASKYELANVEFITFSKGTELTGRAKNTEKGFLTFDLKNPGNEKPFASVIATHLQHSEIPDAPELHEVRSRFLQMKKIAKKVKEKTAQNLSIMVTGDLNQNEAEMQSFLDSEKGLLKRDNAVLGIPTWGGDAWCKRLMGEPASTPQVLDYTFIAGSAKNIQTKIIPTDFDSQSFGGTSDHYLLVSDVLIGS